MTPASRVVWPGWSSDTGLVTAPGVYDPFSALVAERNGFRAIYLAGNAMGLHLGLGQPFVSSSDTLGSLQAIRRVCDLPMIVDSGAGFGDPAHAAVTMRSLESAGAAAVHIDDQVYPKRAHYHRGLTRLVAVEEMVAKLAAMKAIRRGTGTLLVARTDALRAGASIDDTIARCQSYVQAGAEAVIVLDLKPEQAPALRENLRDIPLFWIGGVDEPVPDTTNLEQVGFAAALYPFMLISATFDAMDNALAVLRETGRPSPGSRSARELAREALDAIGFDALLEIETRTTERGGSA